MNELSRLQAENDFLRQKLARYEYNGASEVRDSGAFYRYSFDVATHEVFWMRSDSTLVNVNQAACERLGYRYDELIGLRVWDWDKTVTPDGWQLIWDNLKAQKKGQFETIHTCKNGDSFPVEIYSHYFTMDGEEYAVALVIDISERKEAERRLQLYQEQLEDLVELRTKALSAAHTRNQAMIEELTAAKEKAEAATHAKSRFLANMSHEIRTPMNGVLGMINLMMETPLTHDQKQMAKRIKHSADSLMTVINDVLDVSKIESGRLQFEDNEFDLSELLSQFAQSLEHRVQQKKINLICPAKPLTHQWFIGDAMRIQQVLYNLAGNAIKFTDAGEVRIHCEVAQIKAHRVRLRFAVEDTGVGIKLVDKGALFDRFTQEDNSTTRLYGGTGLGLNISKQIVEHMGGEIGVDSVPGQGSRFWFDVWLKFGPKDNHIAFKRNTRLAGTQVAIASACNTRAKQLAAFFALWQVKATYHDNIQLALNSLMQSDAPQRVLINFSSIPIHMDQLQGHNIKVLLSNYVGNLITDAPTNDFVHDASIVAQYSQVTLFEMLQHLVGPDQSESQANARHLSAAPESFAGRILVAEDNSTNRMVIKGLLQNLGLQVEVVENGQLAVNEALHHAYDLVFMDCNMPVMDGYEATRELRIQLGSGPHAIPIVALTANAMAEDRQKCLLSSMNDYLAKPIRKEQLVSILRRWLTRD